MTAQEIRQYRNMCKKLTEPEERSKLLNELNRLKVGLSEDEFFAENPNKIQNFEFKEGGEI